MKKIGIIGTGIFGCSTALELAKFYDVTLIDRNSNIMEGASTVNHLRHHLGFHYPRSKETVEEIKRARMGFEGKYGDSLSKVFNAYYGVSKADSKTTPKDFIKFCDDSNLDYVQEWPQEKYMPRFRVGVCIKTPERVYDPDILKGILLSKIRDSNINMQLDHKVIAGGIDGKNKKIITQCQDKTFEGNYDYIINATYSNFNSFHKWFGLPRKKFQYELVELLELVIPNQEKIGLTMMDGEFSSVLPRGEKGTFTLGHVNASILERKVSDDLDPLLITDSNKKSNKYNILKKGQEDFPFLEEAIIAQSLFVTRVVKADVDATDERPSEITNYGNGMYSIFGGKVITSVDIAKRITYNILHEDKN